MLKRKYFENYLIIPEAIAHAFNLIPSSKNRLITDLDVSKWIEKNGGQSQYIDTSDWEIVGDLDWQHQVNGRKILEAIFEHFSQNHEVFIWERDGVRITDWLADNNLAHFNDIEELQAMLTGEWPE